MHRFLRGARRALLAAVVLSALSACGGGGGGGAAETAAPVANNKPPQASILGSGDVRAAAAGGIGLGVTLGGIVRLDASASIDPDSDALSFEWSLIAKPEGSAVTLTDTKAKTLQFSPDAIGTYTVALKLNDGRGGQTTQQLSIAVDNRPPTGNVVVEPSFTATPTEQAAQSVSVGGTALFNAEGSTDPDGHAVTIRYELVARPAGSSAALVIDGKRARLDIDLLGSYRVKVIGSDGRASFETTYPLTADNRAPMPSATVVPTFTVVPVQAAPLTLTVGASVLVDATASTDPDGDTVSVGFAFMDKPGGSTASLVLDGSRKARFVADLGGTYRVKVTGSDGRASYESIHTFTADNRAPVPVVVESVTPVVAQGQGYQIFNATVGYIYQLDSTPSSDPDNNLSSRRWDLLSTPAGSAATLSSSTAIAVTLSPDLLGDYVLQLTVIDARGASTTSAILVRVNNRRPVAAISTNATPQALPSAPSIRVPRNTQLTLRGGNSLDADGDPLTFLWTLDSGPAGSAAALSSSSAANPTITVDADGAFVFRLRVTDPAGAFSERSITVNVGNDAPVAVIDRSRLTVLAGDTARASAALSFDRDGDALSYSWTLDARPTGSAATIASPNQAALAFVPDMAGTYVATVSVSDGRLVHSAAVEVRVLAAQASSVPLTFTPIDARYDAGLDKLVILSTNPNSLRLVDPFTGNVESVALPAAASALAVSADGKLAAALHSGAVSLIDLQTVALIRTSSTLGVWNSVMVDDAGYVMACCKRDFAFNQPLKMLNGRTGDVVPANTDAGYMAGTSTNGVFVSKLNKGIVDGNDGTPTDLHYFVFDPATHRITSMSDGPYHGDYALGSPLHLTQSEDYVFTWSGNYFRTSDLRHAGRVSGLTTGVASLSNFAATEETLIVDGNTSTYPSSYKRYTSGLFLPDTDLALPQIGGRQSYAMRVFHSAMGRHVVLVQVGSATAGDAGVTYSIITR